LKQRAEYWLFGVAVFDQALVAAVLAWTWRLDLYPDARSLLVALLLVPFWAHVHRYFGLYDSHRLEGWPSAAARTFTASTVGFLLTSVVLLSVGLRHQVPNLAVFTLTWIVSLLLSRAVLYTVLQTMRRRGVDRRYVCVIGSWQSATEMAERFRKRPEWGLRINTVGVGGAGQRTFYRFPDNARLERDSTLREDAAIGTDLEDVIREEGLDELLIISRPEDVSTERSAIDFCKKYGVQCRISLLGEELESAPVDYTPGHVALVVHNPQMNALRLWMKRAVDIVLSGAGILLLSPLFAVVAILVKLSSPGPVFFHQTRVGLRGRKFVVIKFRTMVDGAESMLHLVAHRNITGGPIFKDAKDLRVTDIGRILRRFSLDELPQLFNVFKGDMSLVGPRPLPVSESSAIKGTYRRRFNMRPGITCHWQVEGRNEIGFARWMELDLEYVDHWSLREDVRLLLRTIPAVLTGRGAY
jgi:exopolysaccharide biosynthesis polyprenyl glycosylphosphotransferase